MNRTIDEEAFEKAWEHYSQGTNPDLAGAKWSAMKMWNAALEHRDNLPNNWLRVVDEEMVCSHLGVADVNDTYEQAKDKFNKLICWNVEVALDPNLNGGLKLINLSSLKQLLEAADEAFSAVSSVSLSRYTKITKEDGLYFYQTSEWCEWLENEIKPKLEIALSHFKDLENEKN